jgi:serine protease AprX
VEHSSSKALGERSSALWGRGGRSARASALWDRGGRSVIAFTLAVAALGLPAAAVAGKPAPGTGGKAPDLTAPETTITSGPADGSTIVGFSSSVTFGFSASEHATFECSVDGGAFASCSSRDGHTISTMLGGEHSFAVRATDRAGNVDQSPAERRFTHIPYVSTGEYAGGTLLAEAQGAPLSTFRVIVQTQSQSLLRGLQSWFGDAERGQLKRSYTLIDAINVKLPGWVATFLEENEQHFGAVTITRDSRLAMTALPSAPRWAKAVKADKLWPRDAVTCQLDPATGLQVDPLCVPLAAYTPAQSPAIAIVDSGVDGSKVEDFGGRVVVNMNFCTLGDCEQTGAGDALGHGTMVAGVAAGAASAAPGVAQTAPIVNLRVANSQGEAQTSDIIAALDWIAANKDAYNIRVVNLSLAGASETSFRFDPLDRAVERLWLRGVVVVAAAGNHGSASGPVKIPSPANDPFVITVGALDLNGTDEPGDDFRAPWSAYGYTADGFAKPELAAPGRSLVMPVPMGSTIPTLRPERVVGHGYMWMSGTSFAAPIVAGAAAQILARRPELSPDQVKGALMVRAKSLKSAGTGVGELNIESAAAVASPPNPNQNLYAFVVTNADGQRVFDAAAWTSHVATSSNWTISNWTASNWTESNWTGSSWAAANWTSSNWTESNWTESNWTQSNWVE